MTAPQMGRQDIKRIGATAYVWLDMCHPKVLWIMKCLGGATHHPPECGVRYSDLVAPKIWVTPPKKKRRTHKAGTADDK